MKNGIFLLILLSLSTLSFGQNYQQETDVLQNGMIVLSSISTANMAMSGYSLIENSNNNKDFHVTNLVWNAINLGIGVWGLSSHKKSTQKINSKEALTEHLKKQRNIVLINAGIDVGYVGFGLWRRTKNEQQGNAIIYNGALLCVFDVLFGTSINKQIKKTTNGAIGLNKNQNGIGISISLN